MKQNKVLKFYKEQIQRTRIRLSKAEKDYEDCIKANIRYFMRWGYFDEQMKQNQMDAYYHYCALYGGLLALEEKYYRVKGCEQCQGANL